MPNNNLFSDELQHLGEMRLAYLKRLRKLELRSAQQGIDTPSHILVEIDDLQSNISDIDNKIKDLEQKSQNEQKATSIQNLSNESLNQNSISTVLNFVIEETCIVGIGERGANIIGQIKRENYSNLLFITADTGKETLILGNQNIIISQSELFNETSNHVSIVEKINQKANHIFGHSKSAIIISDIGRDDINRLASIMTVATSSFGLHTIAILIQPISIDDLDISFNAKKAIDEIRHIADTTIIISSDNLISNQTLSRSVIHILQNNLITQTILSLIDLSKQNHLININYQDIKELSKQHEPKYSSIGFATGPDRILNAAAAALASPFLVYSAQDIKGILFFIFADENVGIIEIYEAADLVAQSSNPDTKIMFGANLSNASLKNYAKVFLIAVYS